MDATLSVPLCSSLSLDLRTHLRKVLYRERDDAPELARSKFFTLDQPVGVGSAEVRLSHGAVNTRVSLDDPNVVSCAGAEPVMRSAQSCDLHGIVAGRRMPSGESF
jgi:hypothetical protein